MTETVYILLGSDRYYPPHDSTIRVFSDREQAETIKRELEDTHGKRDHKERYAELREKYEWLPEYSSEFYTVEEYEVHD